MNKILILAILIGTSITSSFAQSTDSASSKAKDTSIYFNGVKVDGKITQFVEKLKLKGFTVSKTIKNGYVMSGKFLGKTIELYIFGTPTSKLVTHVDAYFPKQTEWYTIKNEYETLKEKVTGIYGNPSEDFAFFSSPYYEGDGYEESAVKIGKCVYSSYWDNSNFWSIILTIEKYMQVSISYENSKNMKIREKEALKLEEGQL